MPCRVTVDRAAGARCRDPAAAAAGQPVKFQYLAGQYLEFILQDGSRRSYSMANAPQHTGRRRSIELHVRHMPGGKFTDHVFGAMKEKEILRMEGPFGSFFLREDADKPIVLLASGTGFAPIKAIIEHMQVEAIDRPGGAVLGLPLAGRPVPARLGRAGRRVDAEPALRAGAVRSRSPKTTGAAAPASSTRR